ncbi:uncharacterized protein TNCV_2636861 [Trichonephila clavipes]|uniref:Uncharacterized protein n=1 Tax=Trichonephila clavipes TaxID=2585209 RepID=A0A8X6UPC1_TRICX|nr:uncharacterized protein TNCV_2636861 [Trichonephila clavipes]
MVSWEYLWPTLRCRRVAGVSPLLSIGWWYLSSESPKRHCCRVSAADKGCRVYPLDPRPDAVALYSGCTSGIGGEPKSVKKLRSGDLLIETSSAFQTKSFLLAKSFLDSPANITPHKSLNSSRGVISEPDLLTSSEAEILEGFSNQVPERVGHSQTACRGQLTCSRCASVRHASSDCSLELKCVSCSQPHSTNSKLCPKWKTEKEIQTLKTNKTISYLEARKLIGQQLSQTYAQASKSITVNNYTQTDENITKIKCPPLSSVPQLNASNSIPSVSTSSSTTQTNILPSASSIKPTTQIESRLPEPISSAASPDNSLNNSASSLSAATCPVPTISNKFAALQPSVPLSESATTTPHSELSNTSEVPQNVKQNSKNRRKRTKAQKAGIEIKMAKHKPRKSGPTEYTTDDEDMLMYDVEEKLE